jgi:hypothetical protein
MDWSTNSWIVHAKPAKKEPVQVDPTQNKAQRAFAKTENNTACKVTNGDHVWATCSAKSKKTLDATDKMTIATDKSTTKAEAKIL